MIYREAPSGGSIGQAGMGEAKRDHDSIVAVINDLGERLKELDSLEGRFGQLVDNFCGQAPQAVSANASISPAPEHASHLITLRRHERWIEQRILTLNALVQRLATAIE